MRVLMLMAGVAVGASLAAAGDWPAYRGDVGRSGYTAEGLKTPLALQWTYVPTHPPRPAWPDPIREENLLTFDHAPQPVAAGKLVYFGSTSDHSVRALDAATGKVRWQFTTDGAIRFAPQVHGGPSTSSTGSGQAGSGQAKLYVAGDDGRVYCLDAATGKEVWRFQAGPRDERLFGNEQIVSRWPLRSGLVIADNTVYLTAGMWPVDGVFAIALNASDGKELWRKAHGGLAPQGYLSIAGSTLFTPAGRAPMWALARANGSGGATQQRTWASIGTCAVVTGPGTLNRNENLPSKGRAALPERPVAVTVWPMRMNRPLAGLNNMRTVAITPDSVYAAGRGKVQAFAAVPKWQGKWQAPFGDAWEIIAAGDAVIVGGTNTVAAFGAADGTPRWTAKVDGKARGLAVAGGRLVVTTDSGKVYCFAPGKATATVVKEAVSPPAADGREMATLLLKDSKVTGGVCLLIGVDDATLATRLAVQSKLRVICVDPDAKKVSAARKRLAAAGLYGRVVVHHVPGDRLPYAPYIANLLIVQDVATKVTPAELYRVLRPAGGVAYRLSAAKGPAWIAGRGLSHEGAVAKQAVKATRGPLAGAGDWTHQYGNPAKSGSSGDTLAKWPMKMLWFGEPGPARILNRHLRGTAPVTAAGRMFILGQHTVIAVDAYNGTELWSRELPSIQRRVVDILGGSMAVDAGRLYLSSSNLVLGLDPKSGQLTKTYRLPLGRPRLSLAKAQTFAVGKSGKITLAATDRGIELTLASTDEKVVNNIALNQPPRGDSWELFFDFRPAAERTGLHGPGVFHAVVLPGRGVALPGPWSPMPKMQVTPEKVQTASRTRVVIPWTSVGGKPAEFAFGAILNASNDGKRLVGRSYTFATPASYRLADFGASMIVDASNAPAADKAPALKITDWPHEQLAWGHLAVCDDAIVGSVVAIGETGNTLTHGWDFSSEGHDYTGPHPGKVLGILGVASRTSYVFAVDKATGRLRWVYKAKQSIGHNAISVVGDRVYIIDRPDPAKVAAMTRRGETPPEGTDALVVLDVATGKPLATVTQDLADYDQLRAGQGVLLAASMGGMTAFDLSANTTPVKLWTVTSPQPMHHCSAFVRAPVITSQWVYDEPAAYALRTGTPRAGWKWGHFRGCGTVSGSEHLLMFRPGHSALRDVSGNTGRHVLVGVRPGCYINMIAACGLVLMQEASSGCGCPYNFQVTVALVPVSQ